MDPAARDRLLHRIGLDGPPGGTGVEALAVVHEAFLTAVPYEALTVQLGEARPLDPDALVHRVAGPGGRGGYCFEVNTVLATLLEALGFGVQRRQAVVGDRDAHARGEPTNHLALVVTTADGTEHIADAGWGEGPLRPLPLREGEITDGPFTWTLERDRDDGWYVHQHEWGGTSGFRFADAPATLADFAPHHERLSTSPDSSFVQTLVVQRPYADRIVTLRARTLSVDGPGGRTRDTVANERHFAATLHHAFGIDPAALGPERVARLWRQACAQHEAFLMRSRAAGRA